MLLAKPIYLQRQYKRKLKAREQQKMMLQQQAAPPSAPNFDALELDPEGQLGQESSTDTGPSPVHHYETETGPATNQFELDTDAILPEMSGNVHTGSTNGKRKDKSKHSPEVETAGVSEGEETLLDDSDIEKVPVSLSLAVLKLLLLVG